MKTNVRIALLACLVVAWIGYTLFQSSAGRTARLRRIYPQGTSREAVQSKWRDGKPDFSALRPTAGWASHQNHFIAEKLQDVEASTGRKVEFVDRYWGPDGFSSLCYCWYFYDSENNIVDVEWQYRSD